MTWDMLVVLGTALALVFGALALGLIMLAVFGVHALVTRRTHYADELRRRREPRRSTGTLSTGPK